MPQVTVEITVDADDQEVYKVSPSYPPGGAVNRSVSSEFIHSAYKSFSSPNYQVNNLLLRFNTGAALPDNAIIDSVSLRAYCQVNGNTDLLTVCAEKYTWNETDADYSATASSDAIAQVALSAISHNAYNTFTVLNPDVTVSKVGYTPFRFHIVGNAPTGVNWFAMAHSQHPSLDGPQLIIDYSLPPAAPPANDWVGMAPIGALASPGLPAEGGGLRGAYISSTYHTGIPWSKHSHWVQPWRAYMETKRADDFLDGIGISPVSFAMNDNDFDAKVQMLAECGIKRARMEIGWGSLDYNETTWTFPIDAVSALQTLQSYGIRPLILANFNPGAPCPRVDFSRTAVGAVSAGATSITLNDVSGITPHFTGIFQQSKRPDVFVTSIAGNTLTLGAPLPLAVANGATVQLNTLKYRPFGPIDQAHTTTTLNGFRTYLVKLGQYVTAALGTAGQADVGYDLEIYNEMTFGWEYLDINQYYQPDLYTGWGVEQDLLNFIGNGAAAECSLAGNASIFSGMELTYGFSNTRPFDSSTLLNDRYTGINKHPYTPGPIFPANEQGFAADRIGEDLQAVTEIPTYTSRHGDYHLMCEQAERVIWDMSPIDLNIDAITHGRKARGVGHPECPVWVTEHGSSPVHLAAGSVSVDQAYNIKARNMLRGYVGYLTKGAKAVFFYHAYSDDHQNGLYLELLGPEFMAYVNANHIYPADPTTYRRDAMASLKRMCDLIATGMNTGAFTLRQLGVVSVTDNHSHAQFPAVGARPPLYDRECLFINPIQRAAKSWVIPYYVMTKNAVDNNYAPRDFNVTMSGFTGVTAGNPADIKCLDPLTGENLHVRRSYPAAGQIRFYLSATDYPRLLSITEP